MRFNPPIIGLTLDFIPEPKDHEYSNRPYSALRADYYQAIEKSGGIPLLLPITANNNLIKHYVSTIDGLILPGGDFDIDPSWYGEKNICSRLNNTRFDFERKLLKAIIQLKKPILGICAGAQLMAVESGGKLLQDITKQVPNCIQHKPLIDTANRHLFTHDITVNAQSLLYNITGKQTFPVNSNHIQAIAEVGNNMKVSAQATDQVIEAIEYLNYTFGLGVEWHPEYMHTTEDQKIFNSFIQAAISYRKTCSATV